MTIAEEYVTLWTGDESGYLRSVDSIKKATTSVSDVIGRASSAVGGYFKSVGGSISDFGASITKVFAPLSALSALALAASSDVNKAFREIRVNTGATGTDLAALKQDFANVFSTVPASAADAGLAIAKLSQLTGAMGPVLDGLATQELNLARITGEDLKGQVEATAKAFNNWKISTDQQGPALDTLFKISQLTGISVTQLAQQVTAGGASARAAGLSFQDTALLMGQLGKAGVDASGIMQGFARSFKQIATKDPKADPAAVLQDIITKIQSAGSAAQANKIAFEAFGRSGLGMADAIKNGRLNIEDLTKALAASKDTINGVAKDTQTFGETMTVLKNKVELALAPLGRDMTGVLKSLMPDLTALINIITQISNAFTALPQSTQTAVAGFVLLAGSIGPIIIGVGSMIALLGGPLTFALIGISALVTVLALDWVSSFETTEQSTMSLRDGVYELAKVLGTMMDAIGVVSHGLVVFGTVMASTTQAMFDLMSGNIVGAWQDIASAEKAVSKEWGQITDEMGGKWADTLQGMVGKAYASVNGFAAAGRAGASAYSAAFLNISPFNPNQNFIGPVQKPSAASIDKIIREGLGPPSAAAGGYAGTGAADAFLNSFGKKAKGGGIGKAMVDAFQDGVAGLIEAVAKLNSSNLLNLFDPLTKKMRAGGQELKSALSVVAKDINDFFTAEGIKGAKVNIAELASNWERFQGVIGKTEAFEKLKEAINDVNVDRVVGGFNALDDSLKLNGKTIEIGISTLRALATAHHEVIDAANKAGFTFKEVFPAANAEFKDTEVGLKQLEAQAQLTFETFFKEQNKVFKDTLDLPPHWAGNIVDQAERVKKALSGTLPGADAAAAGLLRLRAALDIRSSIDSVISDIQRYGEQLGLSGKTLEDYVENKTRTELGKFVDINRTDVEAAIEAHKKAAITLPGIWNDVFAKMSSGAKSWAASIFGVLDTIPGKFGSTVKKVTDTINQWAAFFNSILALLHRFVDSDIPSSLSSLVGLFKKTVSAVQVSTTGITDSIGLIIKNFTSIGDVPWDSFIDSAKTGLEGAASAVSGVATKAGSAIGQNITSGISSFLSSGVGIAAVVTGAIGLFVSTFQSQSKAIRFAGGAALGGLLGGFLSLFFGGPSELDKAKMAAQLQQARDAIKLSEQTVLQAIETTKQAMLTTLSSALNLAPLFAEFEDVSKSQIRAVFRFMDRLVNNFLESAKQWVGVNIQQTKDIADMVGSVFSALGQLPAVANAINTTFNISDAQMEAVFNILDRIILRWSTLTDQWIGGASKRIKKVADRIAPAIDLMAPLIQSIKDSTDLKDPSDESFSVIGRTLDRIILMVSDLANKYEKPLLKALQNLSEKVAPALDLWKSDIEAIKASVDLPMLKEADADNAVSGMRLFIDKLIAGFAGFNTAGLAQAVAIAQSITPIAAALKAWAEAAAVVRGYVAIASTTWDDIKKDFDLSVSLMLQMLDQAIRFIPDAIKFEDTMKTIADHLKQGLAYITEGIQAAQSAFLGLVNVISQPQQPIVGGNGLGGQSSVTTSSLAGLSGGYITSAPPSKGHSSVTYQVNVNVNGNLIHQSNVTDAVIEALVRAQRAGRLKQEVV